MSNSTKKWLRVLAVGWLVCFYGSVFGQPLNPIIGPTLVCPGSVVTYQLTSTTSGNTYEWTLPGGGGVIIGSNMDTMVTIMWQDVNGGPFSILMTESDMMLGTQGNILDVTVADDIARYPFNCFSEVNIPLDINCQQLIEPQHLLTSGVPDCANTFEISLTLDGNIPVPNPVTEAFIGEIITATIRHPETGRSCSSIITLKDGNIPILTCMNDTTICNDPLAWDPFHPDFNRPTVTDNCSEDLVAQPQGYEWVKLFGDTIFSDLIIRNWDAVDKYGNRGECTDTIFLRRVIFDSIMCPPDTTISCNSPNFDPTDPNTSGVPTYDGFPIYANFSYCDIGIEYSDKITYKCPGNYKIYREWVITDVGPTHGELICNQVINVIDTLGPEVTFDSTKVTYEMHDDLFGINPDSFYKTVYFPTLDYGCVAHGYFPAPILTDHCSPADSLIVDLSWDNGHIRYLSGDDSHSLRFENLSRGKHVVKIKVADGCHNFTYDTLIAVAKDIKPPYMAIDRHPVVSLGNYADVTWIDVSVFDEGTWDNCGINFLMARRLDWATACGVDLCDDKELFCENGHNDSIWCATLEEDGHLNEVEARYVNDLRWLCQDGDECSELVLAGWAYDLLKYATSDCADSGYDFDEDAFKEQLMDTNLCVTYPLQFLPCFKTDSTYEVGDSEASNPFSSSKSDLDIAAQIGGGWSTAVPFCCEDACQEVVIEVLAMDYWCNFARSWATVKVEDKSVPEVRHRLPDLEISCYAYNHYYRDSVENGNWDVFGKYVPFERYADVSYTHIMDHICTDVPGPDGDYHETIIDTIADGVVLDNCGLTMKETQKVHFEKCGVGWIERIFTFSGRCGTTKSDSIKVVQRINIYNDCPLREIDIIWPPKDTTFYACGIEPFETLPPKLKKEDECREIGIHYKDQVLDVLYNADSTCFKIIRKWAVIDWCRQTADFHDDWIGDQQFHYYEFDQIIYVKDINGPTILDCDIDSLCIGSECTATLNATVDVIDSCSSREEISLSWSLFQLTDFGYDFVTAAETDTAKADKLEIGTYKLVWKAVDGCNNEVYCTDYFDVLDCVKPSPVCLTSTTVRLWPVDLNQNGQIDTAVGEIWAQELDVSSHDNCQSDLVDFRIRFKGTGTVDNHGNLLPPDSASTKLSLGCEHVGTHVVEMWVVDESGNADFCEVLIEVTGPIEGCSSELGRVNGLVSNMKGAGIPSVLMTLSEGSNIVASTETRREGKYDFASFKLDHRKLSLRPSKRDNPVDGISTQDLIAISKHILGKETLENDFQKEAADANGDGKISVVDLIAVRKLILGKVDSLSVSQPWIFYNHQMEGISQLQLPDYHDQLNFTGVKIGDVNGDAARINDGKRNAGQGFLITYQNQKYRNNDMMRIPLTVAEDIEMEGLQFQLEMKGIALSAIESSLPDIGEENWSLIDGRLTVSWIAESPLSIEPGDTLMTLIGTSKMHDELLNQLSLTDKQVKSEIYSEKGARKLQLIGEKMAPNVSGNTLSAFPNPFRSQNILHLNLSQTQQGSLRIYGIDGRTYFKETKRRSAGEHETLILRDDLGPAGVYFVEYRSEEIVMNYRIVLLE